MRAREIVRAVAEGTLDPVALAGETARACRESQPRLNAFTIIDGMRAEADARAVQARLHAGETLPLAGVPLIVKDNIWAAGWPTTQGSKVYEGHVSPRDALAVARARQAGAIVVGIGTCSEFASKGQTTTPLYGVTRHPDDPSLTPGGSSGGNSAAIGAGLVPLGLGTDGGGSSRRPPAHCGIVGFKPSYGAIAHPYGFPEPFWWLSCIAPMARDVADCTLLFEAVVGEDPADPESRPVAPAFAGDPAGLRVAFAPKLGLDVPVDPDVEAAFGAALAALSSAVSNLHEAAPEWPDARARQDLMASQFAGLAAFYGDRWRAEPELFDPDIGVQIERGLAMPATTLAGAMESSLLVRRAAARFFADFDLLISPTTPCVAWSNTVSAPAEIGGMPVDPRGHAVFTPLFNHAWTPALSVPCGRGRDNLPVGMQIVGPIGQDRKVLAFAAFAERVFAAAGLWSS